MLAMQLPPRKPQALQPAPSARPSARLAPAATAGGSIPVPKPKPRAQASQLQPMPARQPQPQPMVLLLDVRMAAPVIQLPESSSR